MKLTEKEAGRALQSLDVLRSELYQFQQFRDELEITHLKGLDDTFAGAKVVISQKEKHSKRPKYYFREQATPQARS